MKAVVRLTVAVDPSEVVMMGVGGTHTFTVIERDGAHFSLIEMDFFLRQGHGAQPCCLRRKHHDVVDADPRPHAHGLETPRVAIREALGTDEFGIWRRRSVGVCGDPRDTTWMHTERSSPLRHQYMTACRQATKWWAPSTSKTVVEDWAFICS